MRELKFRVWDKQNKNWITENGQSLHCFSNWSICPFTGKLTDYVGVIDSDHGETYTANPAPDYYFETYTANPAPDYYFTASGVVKEPRYVVQQYTGLKDRKGVEVYEGDIVVEKITEEMAANGDSAIIGKVYFAAGTFMIDGDGPLYNHVHSLSPDVLEDFIVAGNMFQTPELLK